MHGRYCPGCHNAGPVSRLIFKQRPMPIPFELTLGWRYTRAGRATRHNGFISFISGVSMLGIALGVAALIIVLSVMNGFRKDVTDRMLSVVPFIANQALLARGDDMKGVVVRGVDPSLEPQVIDVPGIMKGGTLDKLVPGRFGIVLGVDLAHSLGVVVGDPVTLLAPSGDVTPAGVVPRFKQMTVVGLFDSGHYEYDSTLAMISLADAERIFRVDGPTGVQLRLADLHEAPEVAAELARTLSGDLLIRDWTQQNKTWFAAVQVEKRMMFIILTLIVAVAAFNLVSTLVMTVTDKRADIAILRTLGASPRSIMGIFVVEGAAA